jgi:competence protein ComEA
MLRHSAFLLIAFSAISLAAAADDKPQLPDAPGKEVVMKVCNACHGAEIVLGHPHSEDGWNEIIADMVQRGAQGSDEELDEVVRYLTKNIKAGQAQAKINVNQASFKAMQAGLGLTEKEVQAIIDARAKAAFKSIDDLKKVPGLDPSKIDARKSRIAFE